MPAEQPADALAGREVGGRYRLIRRIGKGGMGVVYEAEHLGLDKRVAIKFLLDRFTDDPEVIERFHREARTASRIGHENIIDVTDVGHDGDGRPYIVMELLDGGDLGQVLSQTGPLPTARAVHVIRQVLRGLEAAHGKGIVHRDMKPENVHLVARAGDPDFVKIMDFGISKIIAANDSKVRLTATGAVIGTPIYMAPEQAMAQAELDHRVDLYAVGVMLYELLAGRPPFIANNYLGLVTQHLHAAPPSLAQFRPDLPPALVATVHRALEKDPARRWQSAAEFARALPPATALRDLDALATLGDTDGVRVVTDGARPAQAAPVGETAQRRSARWILGAGVVVAIGMVAVAFSLGAGGAEEAPPAVEPVAKVEPPAPAPEVTTLGRIDVRVTPPGAKVYVDDVYKGAAPVLITGIAAGEHDVRIERDGYVTIATTIRVGGGAPYVIEETMVAIATPEPDPEPVKIEKKKTGKSVTVKKSEPEQKQPEQAPAGPGQGQRQGKGSRPGQKPNPYD